MTRKRWRRCCARSRIAGAGLDVFEEEPLYESPLFALENTVLTPHQAGLTAGGKMGAAVRAARNALEVLERRDAARCHQSSDAAAKNAGV